MGTRLRRLRQQAYFGCLITLLLGLVGMIGTGAFFWWRLGGMDGIQKELLVRRTVQGVHRLMLQQRPDGVAESEIDALYGELDQALTEDRVDLDRLYTAIKDYLSRYHGTGKKPSNAEMRAALEAIRASIAPTAPNAPTS